MADLTIGLQTWLSFYLYKNETNSIISRGQYEDLKGKNMTVDLYFYKENNKPFESSNALHCVIQSYQSCMIFHCFTVGTMAVNRHILNSSIFCSKQSKLGLFGILFEKGSCN